MTIPQIMSTFWNTAHISEIFTIFASPFTDPRSKVRVFLGRAKVGAEAVR